MPRQEIINPVDGMIGDMRQHVTQPSFGIDTVQLGRADQRVDRGGSFATAVGAGEQIVAPANGDATQGAFGRRVVNLDGAVVTMTSPPPARGRAHEAEDGLVYRSQLCRYRA